MTHGMYRRKPEIVEAWQFTEARASAGSQPYWLSDAFLSGRIYYQGGERPYITLNDELPDTAPGRIYYGDWLAMSGGWLWSMKEEEFSAKYEPVPEDGDKPWPVAQGRGPR